MRVYLFLLFFFLSTSASAQHWYKKSMRGKKTDSFIVTLEGDTIQGQVEFDKPHRMASRITFYPEGSDKSEKYRPSDIKGFAIYGKLWVSKRVRIPIQDPFGGSNRTVNTFLLPIIEEGPIQMYHHYYNGYFMTKDGRYIPAYGYVLLKEGEKTVYMSADEDWLYDNQVYNLLSDCEEIITGIQSEKFVWDDLVTLINRYNAFMEEKEEEEDGK